MFSESLDLSIPAIFLNIGFYVLVILFILIGLRFQFKDEDCKFIFFYGFGFIYAKPETRINDNLNLIRKTKNKTFFINAPKWFNTYIINIGGKKN